jgi:small-conductance mechanosensitive channel
MALSQLGISAGALMIVAGAVFATAGAVIVVGMKDIASNVVAGLHLLYEKTLSVGDNIQLGEHEGIIEDIGFVKSVIKTKDGKYVMVPNSELMKRIIIKK